MGSFFRADTIWQDLAVLIAAILLALLAHYILFQILRRSQLIKKEKMDLWCKYLYAPARILFIIIVIFIIYPSLEILTANISPVLRHILSIIFIITIAWLIIRGIGAGSMILMKRYDLSAADNYDARKAYTQFHIIQNILIFLVIIITIGIILMTFEPIKEIGISLLTSAGIAGIILGFAAQKLIATVLAGIQIAFTQPIRIDDVVIVEKEWGRIEEITLTYVVVLIWDQRRLVVPTTYFIETPFQNWTRKNSQILGTIYIHTDYEVPFNKLRDELSRLLKSSPLWDQRVNVLQVTDARESTIELRALVSASNASTAWDLRVFIREKLIEYLRENYPESLPCTRIRINEIPTEGEEENDTENTF